MMGARTSSWGPLVDFAFSQPYFGDFLHWLALGSCCSLPTLSRASAELSVRLCCPVPGICRSFCSIVPWAVCFSSWGRGQPCFFSLSAG
jgi:hypothetical protein